MSYPVHPVAAKFPRMEGEAYELFKQSIKLDGLIDPIQIYQGQIVDGINRERACRDTGTEPRYEEVVIPDGMTVEIWIIAKNLCRRHLTPAQAAKLALDLRPYVERGMGSGATGRDVDTALADAIGVSESTIYRAKQVQDRAVPALKDMALDEEAVPLGTAAELSKLPPSEQEKAVKAIRERTSKGESAATAAKDESEKRKAPKKKFVQAGAFDQLGGKLPLSLRDSFGDTTLKGVHDALETLIQAVKRGRGWNPYLSEKPCEWLENAQSMVRAAIPYAVCPKCRKVDEDGTVTAKGCQDCRLTGWVPEWVYEDQKKREGK